MSSVIDTLVMDCRRERMVRWAEYCLESPIRTDFTEDEVRETGDTLIVTVTLPVSAREVMGRNFSGLAEFEKERGLPELSTEEYALRGLTHRVPWRMETLLSPCPFNEGALICQTHFLGLVEARAWEGTLPSPDSLYRLEWFLMLKRAPLGEGEVAKLVLPAEYKPQRILNENLDGIEFVIKRKPEKKE